MVNTIVLLQGPGGENAVREKKVEDDVAGG